MRITRSRVATNYWYNINSIPLYLFIYLLTYLLTYSLTYLLTYILILVVLQLYKMLKEFQLKYILQDIELHTYKFTTG